MLCAVAADAVKRGREAAEEARMMELVAEAEHVRKEQRRAAKEEQDAKEKADKERRARRYPRNNGRIKALNKRERCCKNRNTSRFNIAQKQM